MCECECVCVCVCVCVCACVHACVDLSHLIFPPEKCSDCQYTCNLLYQDKNFTARVSVLTRIASIGSITIPPSLSVSCR